MGLRWVPAAWILRFLRIPTSCLRRVRMPHVSITPYRSALQCLQWSKACTSTSCECTVYMRGILLSTLGEVYVETVCRYSVHLKTGASSSVRVAVGTLRARALRSAHREHRRRRANRERNATSHGNDSPIANRIAIGTIDSSRQDAAEHLPR
jgi:hypothetical protein